MEIFLAIISVWLPRLFYWGVFAWAFTSYVAEHRSSLEGGFFKKISYKKLALAVIIFKPLHAAILTFAQWQIWEGNRFTMLLLETPLSESVYKDSFLRFIPFFESNIGYFLFYALSRFWLSAALSIIISFAFWRFLILLKKRNERFFEEGETELGFLMALIAGWPGFVVFLALAFVSIIPVSIFRKAALKKEYTTLGPVMILAALLTLAIGPILLSFTGLNVLKI